MSHEPSPKKGQRLDLLIELRRAELSKPLNRIPTGFPLLDRALTSVGCKVGGFVCPSVVTIGGPTKSKKSMITQKIVENHAKRGGKAYCIDVENGEILFMRKMLIREARLGDAEFERGLTGLEQKRWDFSIEIVKEYAKNIWFRENPPKTPDEITKDLMEWKNNEVGDEPIMVVIDSLHKQPKGFAGSEREAIDQWLHQYEVDKSQMNLIVVIVSELNRHGTGINQYKGSSEIGYTSATPILLEKKPNGTLLVLEDGRYDDGQKVAMYNAIKPYYEIEETEYLGD